MKKLMITLFSALVCAGIISNPTLAVVTETTPWMRLEEGVDFMRMSPNNQFLAYRNHEGHLKLIELSTRNIFSVTQSPSDRSLFWSPDGFRLFYRESYLRKGNTPETVIKAYDAMLKKSVVIETLGAETGFLNFDPRDLRLQFLTKSGIHTKKVDYPDSRLARWQTAKMIGNGRWLATQNGIMWTTKGGLSITRMVDDQSPIQSFAISPNGENIAWTTTSGQVYMSLMGATPMKLGPGKDPAWDPKSSMIAMAASRMVGNKSINYDLKIVSTDGTSKFVTSSQYSSEIAPQWTASGSRIIYGIEKSTDLFTLDVKP